MENDSKKNAIEQACEHLGFDWDDTQPVEVVHDVPFNTQEIMMQNLLVAIRSALLFRKLDKAERLEWVNAIDIVFGEAGE